ncbi:LysE family translocator [Actinomadura sp. ATCC 31491]|uniref:LysE family translocator n=1 Tax=Actinomadura luzonensis TaxID=2805427 RepID=A0ABT0G5A2_9ACTN|nr:LysE family translocator [Actinomadura luzonensis]MCK2219345.1 LysE family translocator [Actinomadura luzonensis]
MYLLAFAGACVLIAMVPGVSTAIILRQTLRSGRRGGLAATLGNETGILLWGLAAAFGLSALLVASQLAYDVMRVVGAVVLVVMGAQSLWQARKAGRAADGVPEPAAAPSDRAAYLAGVGTCLANPKAAVFAMSFLPQFVPAGQDVPATLVTLAVVWVLIDLLWYALLIWAVAKAKDWLGRPAVRRRLEQVSGVVLIGLGVRLVVESR